MSEEIHERIDAELAALLADGLRPRRGGPVALARARHAATYFDLYFEPGDGDDARPAGLRSVGLRPELAAELRHLVARIERLELERRAAVAPFSTARVRAVTADLLAWLGWVGEPGTAVARQVADLRRVHRRSRGRHARVGVLAEVLLLATDHEAALRAVPAFDAALLAEARAHLAAHERGDGGLAPPAGPRDALYTLLRRRVDEVDAGARMAFRRHPELAAAARLPRGRRRVAAPDTPLDAPAPLPAACLGA